MKKFFAYRTREFFPVVVADTPVKRLLLVFFPLFLFCAAQAPQARSQAPQSLVVQKTRCVAATSCAFPSPVKPGDMLVVIVGLPPTTSAVVTDKQGDTFYQIYTTGWFGFGDPGPMWYATGVFGGNVTIESTAKALDIFLAEYPPAALDQVSQQTFLCCLPSATVGPLTLKSPNNLIITWVIFGTNATIAPSPGFTMEDDGTSIAVEDVEVGAGTYDARIPSVLYTPWGARMVSFKLLGPAFSKYRAPYSPIQVKTCPRGADGFVLPCQFDASVAQGNMLVVAAVPGCSPNGSGCNSVSDSESNNWNIGFVVPNFNGILLWYALDAKGGADTVYFAPGTGRSAIIAEYPASLGLEDANYGTYNDPIFHQPNGTQTNLDVTRAIQTKGPCDLLIAWGISGTANLDAGPGANFKLRKYDEVVNLALEDATSGVPGAYIGSMTWSDHAHWDMGVAAFNLGGCK